MAESRRLLPWLNRRIWPLEASHTPETMAVSVILGLRELLSSGCCGLLDMGSVQHGEVTAELLSSSGVHGLLGTALMDRGPSFIAKPLPWLQCESRRVRSLCRGKVRYALTPRFVLSCSRAVWEWVRDQDPKIIRSTHSSEAREEMQEPEIGKAGGNVKLLNSLGFLGGTTVLAHCVHLEPGEIGLLEETGTAVAHCPWANLKLGSGIADVPGMTGRGIPVIPSSDGAACNNLLDLSSDLRLAMGLASVMGGPDLLTGEKWFSMSTAEAASFLGFDMEKDRVHLGLCSREVDELCTSEDPWRYIIELPWRERVRKVICGGQVLYDNGDFPTLPPLPIPVRTARERVLAGMGRIG